MDEKVRKLLIKDVSDKFDAVLASKAGEKPKPFTETLQAIVTGETDEARKEREEKVAAQVGSVFGDPSPVRIIAVDDLSESPTNPRTRFEGLDELGASMLAGVLVPLIVRPKSNQPSDSYEIIAGHRRFRAAKLVGISHLPCDVRSFTDVQVVEAQAIENLQRVDLDALEEAASYESLRKHDWSVEQIASKTGRSPSLVRSRLRLLTLAPEAMAALRDGVLPHSVAVPLSRIPHAKQAEAVKEFKAEQKSQGSVNARQAIDWLQRDFTRNLKGASFDIKDEMLDTVAGACSTCPKNSANGQAGFEDLQGAGKVCTDVQCFNGKAEAAWVQTSAKLKEEGYEVLSKAEGAELFQHGHLGYDSKFVELSVVNNEDPKRRSWGELVDKMPEDQRPMVVAAPDRDLKIHHLVERKKVVEKLADGGTKWAQEKVAEKKKATKERVKEREHKEAIELENEVLAGLASSIASKLMRVETLKPVWHLLASYLAYDYLPAGVLKAMGLKADDVLEEIDKGKDSEFFASLVLAMSMIEAPDRQDEKLFGPYMNKLAGHFDLKLKDIEAAKLEERAKAAGEVKPRKTK